MQHQQNLADAQQHAEWYRVYWGMWIVSYRGTEYTGGRGYSYQCTACMVLLYAYIHVGQIGYTMWMQGSVRDVFVVKFDLNSQGSNLYRNDNSGLPGLELTPLLNASNTGKLHFQPQHELIPQLGRHARTHGGKIERSVHSTRDMIP